MFQLADCAGSEIDELLREQLYLIKYISSNKKIPLTFAEVEFHS